MDTEERDRQRLGMRIRAIREDQGMTQEEVANAAGMSRSYVTQIERAQKSPSYPVLFRMAEALNVSIGDFFHNEEPPTRDVRKEAAEHVYKAIEQLKGTLVPIVGYVPADSLRWTGDEDLGTIDAAPSELKGAREPFAAYVRGNCMASAHILEGDLVIFDAPQGRRPQHRQIVLVTIDGEHSLKRWHQLPDGRIELRDGDEHVVHAVSEADSIEIRGLYVTHRPLAPR